MRRSIVLSNVMTICLCGLSMAQPNAPAPKQPRTTAKNTFPEFPPLQLGDVKKLPKIRQLQVERFKVAQEWVRIVREMYLRGARGTSGGEMAKAMLLLMESRLDLAQTDTERVALLKVGVSMAKRIEMEAEAKRRVGGVAGFHFSELPQARIQRLTMEIRLERAKQQLKKRR
jgi:hypothetical protein